MTSAGAMTRNCPPEVGVGAPAGITAGLTSGTYKHLDSERDFESLSPAVNLVAPETFADDTPASVHRCDRRGVPASGGATDDVVDLNP